MSSHTMQVRLTRSRIDSDYIFRAPKCKRLQTLVSLNPNPQLPKLRMACCMLQLSNPKSPDLSVPSCGVFVACRHELHSFKQDRILVLSMEYYTWLADGNTPWVSVPTYDYHL